MKVNVSMDLTVEQAFKILLDVLYVKLDDNPPKFEIDNGEIICDDDDRGELYLALYHLATKIFPNTEFRHLFDNPNTIMSKLYTTKENEDLEQESKIGHCKECKYFEYDSVAKVDGIPLIIAHEICKKWGDGCKTSEDGYCFLFEPQESEE